MGAELMASQQSLLLPTFVMCACIRHAHVCHVRERMHVNVLTGILGA
jgi:hypothetical protein